MYQKNHPAYKKLGSIGKEITTKVKPDAVVVFSAHWQGGEDVVHVNTAEMTDLIYEYVHSQLLFALVEWMANNTVLVSTASLITSTRRNTRTSEAGKLQIKYSLHCKLPALKGRA